MFRRFFCLILIPAVLAAGLAASPAVRAQGPAPTDPHMQWWRDARFGMFIHWGPASVKGVEISWGRKPNPFGPNPGGMPAAEYDELYKQFNPVKFNAKAVVAMAKAAGMKYIVFTTKHHDGFCEFDSKYTDYKITSPESPYGKDIVKQLADATHAAGLHWGVYYSQLDTHQPDYLTDHAKYNVYFHNQMHELLTNYGLVDLVWFDGNGNSADYWDADNLFRDMRAVNPNLIINNRCGLPGDYYTPEQTIGGYDDQKPWETCMTIGGHWSYSPTDTYKSSVQCIQTLARCIGGDGNLLLNIGPRPDGTVDPTQADRLKAIAKWMKVNNSSVYGTRGGPYKPAPDYACTRKGSTIYLHLLNWDGDSVVLPALPKHIVSTRLLGGGTAQVSQTSDAVTVTIPDNRHNAADTVVALTLDGTAMDISPISPQPKYINITGSNTYQNDSTYAPARAFDGDDGSRWATDDGIKKCWISADLSVPRPIKGVEIHEAYGTRVQKFEFQVKGTDTSDWVTVASGRVVGPDFTANFSPVFATSIRLNVLDATDPPTISEIKVLSAK